MWVLTCDSWPRSEFDEAVLITCWFDVKPYLFGSARVPKQKVKNSEMKFDVNCEMKLDKVNYAKPWIFLARNTSQKVGKCDNQWKARQLTYFGGKCIWCAVHQPYQPLWADVSRKSNLNNFTHNVVSDNDKFVYDITESPSKNCFLVLSAPGNGKYPSLHMRINHLQNSCDQNVPTHLSTQL